MVDDAKNKLLTDEELDAEIEKARQKEEEARQKEEEAEQRFIEVCSTYAFYKCNGNINKASKLVTKILKERKDSRLKQIR